MKTLSIAAAEPRIKSAFKWRVIGTALLSFVLVLGFTANVEGKKGGGGKPPPEPPPVSEGGSMYLTIRGDWGNGPLEVWQMDDNGSNLFQLFSVDLYLDNYLYKTVVPSQHTYGGSRLFACVKRKTELDWNGDYYDTEWNGWIDTGLVIVDEQNNEIIDLLPGDYMAINTNFVWYDNDSKLAFIGREIFPDPNNTGETDNIWMLSDWNTLGIYTIDLSVDPGGSIMADPPVLMGWTHAHLVSSPTEELPFPVMLTDDFTIQAVPDGPDLIYFSKWDNPYDYDRDLYRAVFDDYAFVGLEFLSEVDMEGLQIDPTDTFVSGGNNGDILYYVISRPEVLIFTPTWGRVTELSSPLWSPSGEHICFGQGSRTPSLTTRSSTIASATWDLQNITVIFNKNKNVRGRVVGWRALPEE